MTNMGVVVVRYFGGTKLGKGGLVRAYGAGAKEAIAACAVKRIELMNELHIRCSINTGEKLKGELFDRGGRLLDATYAEDVLLQVEFPIRHTEALLSELQERNIHAELASKS